MEQVFQIQKVAVLGAGVMGAQIAAHCVNAGFITYLFDLASKDGNHNAIVNKSIAHLKKLKPTPLATPETVELLQAKNYQDDLADLSECDLIIEAIAERLDWKQALYEQIAPYLADHTILVTNTSGLSVNTLAKTLPESHRNRFCGVHFFNPPRYMHLAELIPAEQTSAKLLDYLETWLTRYLGKGVVRAKDTPNFIANRIGVFSLLSTMIHAEKMEIGLDVVDALTGIGLGRPKSATFRTMDVVGLDTMNHVVHTMQEQLQDDAWHPHFSIPEWINHLISQDHLGQKTNQGIYRKQGKTIEVFDIKSNDYRPVSNAISPEVQSILRIPNIAEKLAKLFACADKQAKFLTACFVDLFHYCAAHVKTIAHSVGDVDLAMRWGFGWQQGPFELWQEAGFKEIRQVIQQSIENGKTLSKAPLPSWLFDINAFYTKEGALVPVKNDYAPRFQLPVYKRQFFPERLLDEPTQKKETVYENEGVRLWILKEDVVVLSFKSKANTIGQAVLDGCQQALDYAEKHSKGLIFYQDDANNFSSGADLRGVAELIGANKIQALEQMIKDFQALVLRIKYSKIPIVAALRGRALGGGCELLLHCDAIAASFESYPGLVEVGVGLIPAGGGCKEMALRAAKKAGKLDVMQWIEPNFTQIATAVVSSSAVDALQRGYLRQTDTWVMHREEVLYAALSFVEYLQKTNYLPPIPSTFKVAGREGHARLEVGLANWLEGGFISQHDYQIANKLAFVLCGGDVYEGTMVDETWLLKLEREAFIELAETKATQARIQHLLETGKPLRN